MIYKIPNRPFPEEIIRMLAYPPDPRAFYRRRVGNFILEPLISIEKQSLLKKAARLAGLRPEDVNLPPIKSAEFKANNLTPDIVSEIRQYIREETILENLAKVENYLKKAALYEKLADEKLEMKKKSSAADKLAPQTNTNPRKFLKTNGRNFLK